MNNITFIGTGNAWNHKHGNCAAIFNFNDTNLLIDCGYTIPAKIDVSSINNIFITHIHGDHVYGLEEIAFKNRYLNNGKKPNLFVPTKCMDRLENLLMATLKYADGKQCTIDDYFNVYKINNSFTINGYKFEIEETQHIDGAYSCMLIGSNFIYTGDTQTIDWTQWDLNGIQYIFHDTQLQKYGNDVHATLPDIKLLPKSIKEKIYCMHYGENIDDFANDIKSNGMKIVTIGQKIEI